MAFSTALSQALRNKIRTSGIQSVKSKIGSQMWQLKDAYQSKDMYDISGWKIVKAPASTAMGGYNPTGTPAATGTTGTGSTSPWVITDGVNTYDTTTGKGTANGTLDANGKPITPVATGTTGTPGATDEGLTAYKASLGITPEDEVATKKAYEDLTAANKDVSNYSSSEYYNQLVQELGRTQEQGKLNELQGAEINQRAAANLQQNEVSKGDEGMLSQARQNAARMLPLNQQLQTNIAQQNLEINKLNNIDQQISLKMQLKSADLNNKVQAIQNNLAALKGKVPDYMIAYANQQLQLKQQEQLAKLQDTLKNGDINSTDPFLKKKAIQNAVQSVFDQYQWLPMNQGVGVHVANIEGLMAKGMSLQDAINQDLIQPIQSKPEFKQWQISKGLVQNPNEALNQKLQNEKLAQDIESGKLIKSTDAYWNPIFIDQKTRREVDITTGKYVDWNGSYTPSSTSTNTTSTEASPNGYTVTPWSSPARPDTNQNPTNIKIGSLKKYGIDTTGLTTDEQGHVKFASAQQGADTALELVKRIVQKYPDVTIGQLGWAEDKSWNKKVAGFAGVSMDTKVADMDATTLLSAMARQEGFTWTISAAQQKQKETNDKPNSIQEAQIAQFKWDYGNPANIRKMRTLGITDSMINSYEESQKGRSNLTDDQRQSFNSAVSSFRANQVVKDFESMYWQTKNVVSSINSNSWPGDIAAVYQFMKTLDPGSVVRESEFAIAAKSAGVIAQIWNMFQKLENWEMLTADQKKTFGQLMQKYLENKSSQYNRIYDDMERYTTSQGIPTSILPKRATDEIKQDTNTDVGTHTYNGKTYKDYTK